MLALHARRGMESDNHRRRIDFLLEKMGAIVQVARDGREALDHSGVSLSGSDPFNPCIPDDLVISNMQMPRINGDARVSHLLILGCDLPIVSLTASGRMETGNDAQRWAATD